jgi:hypothetical protein
VSIYGWAQGHDGGFTARHPELRTSKGTIRLRPDRAADIPDGEFRDVVRAALDGGPCTTSDPQRLTIPQGAGGACRLCR